MDPADAAMFVALLAVFAAGVVYVRVNELEQEIETLKREKAAGLREALNEAPLSVTHHRSGERPRGALLVHNAGKGVATDVAVHINRTNKPAATPVIEGNVATIERIAAGQRVTIDTTTESDDTWPIDVLVTWVDARGPQSTLRRVSR